MATPLIGACQKLNPGTVSGVRTKVAFVKTNDRVKGVSQAVDLLGLPKFKKKGFSLNRISTARMKLLVRPTTNTLKAIVSKLRDLDSGELSIGDRSGMANTKDVFENKKIFRMVKNLSLTTVIFADLSAEDWELVKFESSHWKEGFYVPKPSRMRAASYSAGFSDEFVVWESMNFWKQRQCGR